MRQAAAADAIPDYHLKLIEDPIEVTAVSGRGRKAHPGKVIITKRPPLVEDQTGE